MFRPVCTWSLGPIVRPTPDWADRAVLAALAQLLPAALRSGPLVTPSFSSPD